MTSNCSSNTTRRTSGMNFLENRYLQVLYQRGTRHEMNHFFCRNCRKMKNKSRFSIEKLVKILLLESTRWMMNEVTRNPRINKNPFWHIIHFLEKSVWSYSHWKNYYETDRQDQAGRRLFVHSTFNWVCGWRKRNMLHQFCWLRFPIYKKSWN